MEIVINDKTYELNFGLKFLNILNNLYQNDKTPVKIDQGLLTVVTNLSLGSPNAILAIVMASTWQARPKLTEHDVEKWLEEQDIEELCDSFLEQFEKSSLTKATMKKIKEEGQALAGM